jgi:hypothetical protein
VVDGENIYSTYGIEQGWRVAQILLFVDMSLIPMQTEWKSISVAPPDRNICYGADLSAVCGNVTA